MKNFFLLREKIFFRGNRNLRRLSFAIFFAAIFFCACENENAAQRSRIPTRTFVSHENENFAPQYTILIYMNGSDLESEFGAATDDLAEMLDSGLDSQNANVIIFTGGANRWQNSAIPAHECVIWRLADGFLDEIKNVGKKNMGCPSTLRDFILFGTSNFPAEKFGLIMWDHGGGSIAGFGQDEKFDDAALTLLDMKKAFDEAGLAQNKLEFLGFDACLMATVEMAVLAADYAKFLIAAEDLEPGEGWNYFFLSALNDKKNICGFEMGKIIVDSFFEYFEEHELTDEEILTLSVVDLANAAQVMDAMGVLTQKNFSDASFKKMAARRATTKTFGEGSPRDNFADMVDVGDMAVQLADLFPREAAEVMRALENCVVYNRHNSETEIFGLSTYYIYGGKSEGVPSLRTYSDLEMSGAYTEFLHEFFKNLLLNHDGENIFTEFVLWEPRGERCGARCAADFENASQPFEQRLENSLSCVEKNFSGEKNISHEDEKNFVREKNILRMMSLVSPPENELLFPKISAIPCGENARRDDGEFVTLFPVSSTRMASMYAIPIFVNDHEADIIVAFSRKHPHGKIKGIRHNSANVFQKGYDPICETDVISFFRLEYDFENIRWTKSEPFSFDAPPSLSWHPAPEFFKTGLRHTDIFNNVTYSVF